jgi:hypothetical protein
MIIRNVLISTSLAMCAAGAANAQHISRKPGSVVTMVCHESGGSGLPLTDYVNNVDVAVWDSTLAGGGGYTTNLPNGLIINTETQANPTSCALATSELEALGFTLDQTFSHFTGYYIEILSSP